MRRMRPEPLAKIGVLLALLVGLLVVGTAPSAASHGGLINATVVQIVNNYGVRSTIETGDPSVAWWLGRFSYMRVAAGKEQEPYYFGEYGWYRGWLTGSSIQPVIMYRNSSGLTNRVAGPVLSVGSWHNYKVVNSQLCNGTPTTLDNAWEFCFDNTSYWVVDLSFQTAQHLMSGGEVNNHGTGMGASELVWNEYLPTSGSWQSTTSVTCRDYNGSPNPPASGNCPSYTNDPGENYHVWGVYPPDNNWFVAGP